MNERDLEADADTPADSSPQQEPLNYLRLMSVWLGFELAKPGILWIGELVHHYHTWILMAGAVLGGLEFCLLFYEKFGPKV